MIFIKWKIDKFLLNPKVTKNDLKCDDCGKTEYLPGDYVFIGLGKGYCQACYDKRG